MAEVKQTTLSYSEERQDEKTKKETSEEEVKEKVKRLLLESSKHSDFVQRCEELFGEELKDIKVAWGSAYRTANLYFSDDVVIHASVRLKKE